MIIIEFVDSSLLAARFMGSNRFLSSLSRTALAISFVLFWVLCGCVSSSSRIFLSIRLSRFEIFLVRHAFEQYLTWSQFLFKDFRHVKVLPQDTQVFLGCSAFMGCRFS